MSLQTIIPEYTCNLFLQENVARNTLPAFLRKREYIYQENLNAGIVQL